MTDDTELKYETKKTNAGTEYFFEIIMPPSSQVYEYEAINNAGEIDGENTHWIVYLTKSEVCKKRFPLNANPRKPNFCRYRRIKRHSSQNGDYN